MSKKNNHKVFKGITLEYLSYKGENSFHLKAKKESTLAIIHCKRGKLEWLKGASFNYIFAGDLAILELGGKPTTFDIHNCSFEGIVIKVNLQKSLDCFSNFFQDVKVEPKEICKRLELEDDDYILENRNSIDHIFEELYNVPDEIIDGYLKIKILELFLFLSVLKPSEAKVQRRSSAASQELLAREVRAYMAKHHDEKITADAAALKFNVSKSLLKNSFKLTFGKSFYSVIRQDKMRMAAEILRHSDRKIVDIAMSFGYENSSKFSKAFYEEIGETPKSYRKNQEKSA